MLRVLTADLYKIRKKMIWFLAFLGPIGVISLQAVNFGVRYDYLTHLYANDLWGGVMENVRMLSIPTLLMGITILSSMIANIEHQTFAWKQVLALPISRTHVFTAKFALAFLLLWVSSTLLGAGALALGLSLDYGGVIPFGKLFSTIYYPFLASMPFLALQIWLSITVKNQAVPLTVGITCAIVSLFGPWFPDWVPIKWPSLANSWGEPLYSVVAGLFLGVVVFLMGLTIFVRKDVK